MKIVVVPAARASRPLLKSLAAPAVGTQEAVMVVPFVVVLTEKLEMITVDGLIVVEDVTSGAWIVVVLLIVEAFKVEVS